MYISMYNQFYPKFNFHTSFTWYLSKHFNRNIFHPWQMAPNQARTICWKSEIQFILLVETNLIQQRSRAKLLIRYSKFPSRPDSELYISSMGNKKDISPTAIYTVCPCVTGHWSTRHFPYCARNGRLWASVITIQGYHNYVGYTQSWFIHGRFLVDTFIIYHAHTFNYVFYGSNYDTL